MKSFELFIESVREIYKTKDYIPLHAPIFIGNEKKYLIDTIDSTLVSSIGSYVKMWRNSLILIQIQIMRLQ